MSEEQINYKVLEKQIESVEIPFKVIDVTPREYWGSNYNYFLKQLREGKQKNECRPMLVRKQGTQFQIYENGEWVDKDEWEDLAEFIFEKDGKTPVLNPAGNQRKQRLIENKKELLVEFENPIPVTFYDKESNSRLTEEHQTVFVRFSNNLMNKIKEQLEDPRNSLENYFKIKYDKNAAPADMYKVVFVR